MAKPIVVEREVRCPASPAQMWPIITDTEQLNRAIDSGALELEPYEADSAARYRVKTTTAGFPLEYEERPFEWREHEYFRVFRKMRGGTVATLKNEFELEPDGDGSLLRVRVTVVPRIGLLSPVMRLQTRRTVDKIIGEFQHIAEGVVAGRAAGFHQAPPTIDAARLDAAAARLHDSPAKEEATRRLVDIVRRAPDAEVSRIRPFEWADHWSLDGRDVLSACLHGVVAGLLELRWDLVCPSCRTASDRLPTLAELGEEGHCQLCDIDYSLAIETAVEATFVPAPAIRQLDVGPYCIGGPARTPHVVSQAILPGGGRVAMRAPKEPGAYDLFVRGGRRWSLDVRDDGAAEAEVTVEEEPDADATIAIAPGAELSIAQAGDRERHAKIEHRGWRSMAATAATLATLPAFRRQFSGEVLKAGRHLRIGRVCILFTDLTDSTALYERVGDAKAFGIVLDHFDLLIEVIEQSNGAVVKTMGDAVMAAFETDAAATAAALALHDVLRQLRADHDDAHRCYLKIGLYEGPCFVFTANGALDYFGQTVNVAARLQAEAKGGELVLMADVHERLREGGILPGGFPTTAFDADLKGVGMVPAMRVVVDGRS